MATRRLASMVLSRRFTTAFDLTPTCKPTDFQKRILVLSQAYENIATVPERVSTARVRKAFDILRARVTVLMTVGGLGGWLGATFVMLQFRQEQINAMDPRLAK